MDISILERKAANTAGMLAAIFGATATDARVTTEGGTGGIAFSLTKDGKRLDVSIISRPNGTECTVTDDARGGEIHWSDSAAELNRFLTRELMF